MGLLLSIALFPQASPIPRHRHFGKIAATWSVLFVLPFAATHSARLVASQLLQVALPEYLPFIILLFALLVISGGIRLRGNLIGTLCVNTVLLALGVGLASFTGTTGAAMLLVRPLIQANMKRRRSAHVIVFSSFWLATSVGADAGRHVGWLGVDGRHGLHRQRAQLHDPLHRE